MKMMILLLMIMAEEEEEEIVIANFFEISFQNVIIVLVDFGHH